MLSQQYLKDLLQQGAGWSFATPAGPWKSLPLEALAAAQGPRVWLGHEEMRPVEADAEQALHEFAVWVADEALTLSRELGHPPDAECLRALEIKRKWLSGEATDEELAAAARAAKNIALATLADEEGAVTDEESQDGNSLVIMATQPSSALAAAYYAAARACKQEALAAARQAAKFAIQHASCSAMQDMLLHDAVQIAYNQRLTHLLLGCQWEDSAEDPAEETSQTDSAAEGHLMLRLRVAFGPHAGEEALLAAPRTLVGRSPQCKLRLLCTRVSRKHCEIVLRKKSAWLYDLGGKNGVLVAGRRIEDSCELRTGDRLEIGQFCFEVTLETSPSPPQEPVQIVIGEEKPAASPGKALAEVPDEASAVRPREAAGHLLAAQHHELYELLKQRDIYLIEELGSGGMAVVYRAEQRALGREVAVKVLRSEQLDASDGKARFKREMKAVAKLDHPNIVRAIIAGQLQSACFLAMDLVDGVEVSRLVASVPLSVADACEIARQTALGLQHAYEHGLVHRDLKPANLVLDRKGIAKILDFGLVLGHSDEALTEQTLVGTFDYIAPEQTRNPHGVDIRADIYSLGCTLYCLLTGEVPFGGTKFQSAPQKIIAHMQAPPPSAKKQRPEVPQPLAEFIQQMMAKNPADRPARPSQVAAALAPFAAGANLTELLGRVEPPEPIRS